jgi:hypothetical protein
LSAAVLALQFEVLRLPLEVLTAPPQTLMVTVTAPVPGDATLEALPVYEVQLAAAEVVGTAVGVAGAAEDGRAGAVAELEAAGGADWEPPGREG